MIIFRSEIISGARSPRRRLQADSRGANIRIPLLALRAPSGRTDCKSGFTLIEVLLALAIIGLVLTPIFVNQSLISRTASRASRLLTRLFTAKRILVENEFALAPDAQEMKSEKKMGAPPTVFTYELRRIPENSSLKKFKNVWIETVSWPDERGKKRKQQLVTLLYKSEEQE
jgi:prepilin-type N-terminal cleavage/methylation domain-containing protein